MHLYNCIGAELVFIFDHLVLFGCFPLRLSTRSCLPFFVSLTIVACFSGSTASPL
ncbi:hypothetical protein Hanom_Chr08g00750501 [Helianthus anomalus]